MAKIHQAALDDIEDVRENGLEVLAEGLGDRRLSNALLDLLKQWDEWKVDDSKIGSLEVIEAAVGWPDFWYREIAVAAKRGWEQLGMRKEEEPKAFNMLDKVMFLKQVTFFANLSLEELGLIAGIAEEAVYPDQTILLRRGEVNESMYVIIEGNIELSVSAEGTEGTIGVLGTKDMFGDTTVLDRGTCRRNGSGIFRCGQGLSH